MEASPPKSDSSSTASSSNRIQNMISFFEKMSEQNQPKPSPSQRKGNSASWSKSESSTMTRGERMKRFQSLPMVKNAKRKREKERKEAPKSAEGEEKEKGKEEEMGDPKESVTKLLSGSHEISRSDVHEGIAARKVMFDRVDGTNQNEKEKKRSPREKPEEKEKEQQSHRASIPVENFSPFDILPREMALQVFSFLDWKSLCFAVRVSSCWAHMCEEGGIPLRKQLAERNIRWLSWVLRHLEHLIEDITHNENTRLAREKMREEMRAKRLQEEQEAKMRKKVAKLARKQERRRKEEEEMKKLAEQFSDYQYWKVPAVLSEEEMAEADLLLSPESEKEDKEKEGKEKEKEKEGREKETEKEDKPREEIRIVNTRNPEDKGKEREPQPPPQPQPQLPAIVPAAAVPAAAAPVQQQQPQELEPSPFDIYAITGTRIDFLKQTVLLLKELFLKNPLLRRVEEGYSSDNQEDLWECADIKECPLVEYSYILGLLNKQLTEAKGILENIKRWDIPLSRNFDLVELSLRRYYHQFKRMFTPTGQAITHEAPSKLISDPMARCLWERRVGSHRYYCNFDWFFEHVLAVDHPKVQRNKEYQYYLSYFLNFPKDDTVTIAKWDLLVTLFGPFEKFFKIFKEYVLGRGFLGLVNRIAAEEILAVYPDRVLIRFSRTAPYTLAFSSAEKKHNKMHFFHSTNAPQNRELCKMVPGSSNVPIDIFLSQRYPKKRLVPMRVDGKTIYEVDKASMSGYVYSSCYSYIEINS